MNELPFPPSVAVGDFANGAAASLVSGECDDASRLAYPPLLTDLLVFSLRSMPAMLREHRHRTTRKKGNVVVS
jgi:hypothetical protein